MWNALHITVLVGCPVLLVVTQSYGLLAILPTLFVWLFLTSIANWTGLGGHAVVAQSHARQAGAWFSRATRCR